MQPHLHPDEYHRLRDAAKRHAVQLRQEAIRQAPAWAARELARLARRVLRSLRASSARANPCIPSTTEATAPCPPLS